MAVVESVLHLIVLWLYYVVQRTINSCTIVTSFDRWTCDVETQLYCRNWSFNVGVFGPIPTRWREEFLHAIVVSVY